tara:strand:- start:3166 stop:3315 length:150 start_codon:yes stop_codon:yes gene_type:complete
MEENKKGLGDLVTEVIKTVAPEFAEKNKDCPTCKKRRNWLNKNFNANFK